MVFKGIIKMSDKTVEAELLKQAIIATDDYLGIYKKAIAAGTASSYDVHDFTAKLSVAMEALKKFEELENHNIYIEDTMAKMAQLFRDEDTSLFDEPFAHAPGGKGGVDEAADTHEVADHEIHKIASNLKWHHIADTYKDHQIVSEEVLDEKITASSRIRRGLSFARTSKKRSLAAKIKLSRPSTQVELQHRATVAARRLLMEKFLGGRDKSQLSAQEKDMLEERLKQMSSVQKNLAQRLIPKIKDLERKRLQSRST
jgi:hypothetical protein